ncbi:hypothetical protein Taro_015583 [Colocasia esculenta]|uniref:Purple acid phosphatase n=1 Tax=Colocasia esculenta TaxID=4460 RepID=A0A843UHR8_COLES|nr:hypothetical protein [Colocasia esculenta]
MYANNAHVDNEVLQGTLNVIGRLSMASEKRLEAELQMHAYRMGTGTYSDTQLQCAVGRVSPAEWWIMVQNRDLGSNALAFIAIRIREDIDDPVFDPTDTTWAEGILDGDEPRDPEFRVPVKRPRESLSKGKQPEIVEDTEEQLEPARYSESDSRPVTSRLVKPPPSLRRTMSGIYMTERANAVARDDPTIEKMRQIYVRRTPKGKGFGRFRPKPKPFRFRPYPKPTPSSLAGSLAEVAPATARDMEENLFLDTPVSHLSAPASEEIVGPKEEVALALVLALPVPHPLSEDLRAVMEQFNTKYYYKIGTGDAAREFWFQTPPNIHPDSAYKFGIIVILKKKEGNHRKLGGAASCVVLSPSNPLPLSLSSRLLPSFVCLLSSPLPLHLVSPSPCAIPALPPSLPPPRSSSRIIMVYECFWMLCSVPIFLSITISYSLAYLTGDLGQTYNSLSTLEHYIQSGGQAVLYVGDLSYADRYKHNDGSRWDSWGRFVERSTAYQAWIWSAGNHEIEYRPDLQPVNEKNVQQWNQMIASSKLLGVDPRKKSQRGSSANRKNLQQRKRGRPGEATPFKAYLHRCATPYVASQSSSPMWYSIRRASAHIIVLSSYSPFVKYTPQWTWLRAELKRVDRDKTPWLIVLMHSPIYNSNEAHYMEGESMRAVFERWFVRYRVDLVFAGHVHAYERSYRISNINYNITTGDRYPVPDKSAPVYITVGDGGNQEGLAGRFSDPQPEYSAFREASYGHSTLELRNRTHAFYHWNRNDDGALVHTDSVVFHNQYW